MKEQSVVSESTKRSDAWTSLNVTNEFITDPLDHRTAGCSRQLVNALD